MLRELIDSDLPRVLEINAANVPAVGEVDLERLGHLVEQSAVSIVDVHDADVVGFCIVFAPGADYDSVNYRWFEANHPDSLYLDRVAFDSGYVGRGLGAAMYAEVSRIMADDFADADGLGLEVNVDPPNEPSLAFHRKLGFAEVGRQMSKGIEVSLMHRAV